jgi:hypothetical protein
MQQVGLYLWMLFVSLCISTPTWLLPVLIAVGLLDLRRRQRKPRQQAYATAATAGMLVGAVVGWISYFLADFVLKIAGREWSPGQRPQWLDLATPQGALVVGIVMSMLLLLATALAHAAARRRGRDGESTGPEAHN